MATLATLTPRRFEEAFQSAEYKAFKDAVGKSASDNRLVIKNNIVIMGKNKVPIPSFVSLDKLKAHLQDESLALFMKYQDLYDKITVSERPEKYRKDYEDTIQKLEDIKQILVEADAFVDKNNDANVDAPITTIEERIASNDALMQSTINSMADNVHVEKKKIQKILKLYKDNMGLHQRLAEAHDNMNMDYVIFDETSKGTSPGVKEESKPEQKIKGARKTMKGGKIDDIQRAAIKTLVKKLMIDKLL
jgi:hypothetical protein